MYCVHKTLSFFEAGFWLSNKTQPIQPKTESNSVVWFETQPNANNNANTNTFSNGCLGSHNDEERSEMRYVMRIAESSESSKL